jgi:hypothetical protein
LENPLESAASAPLVTPKAPGEFGDPLPPLPELPNADPPASAFGDPVTAAPIATDGGASNRRRARRAALVIGGVACLIGLLGLLRVVLGPAAPGISESASATETAAQTAAPVDEVAKRPAETVTLPPAPSGPALAESSAASSDRKNPPLAPTKPQQHADDAPGQTAPPENYRRPEVRLQPVQKEFRPNGI